MPWFALDDGFDTHPKVRKAGNAAVGLFVRLGVHATKHLTEGHLDGDIVRDYGTAPTIRKLVTVGMLHDSGHSCPRCPQPADGGFYIHDYLDYNKSRAQIEAAREHARKRQQKGRDSTRQNRNGRDSGADSDPNERRNDAVSGSNRRRNEPLFQDEPADQDDLSRRDTHEGEAGVPSPPLPSPPIGSGEGRERADRSSGRAPQPPLSLITNDWTPSTADRQAAAADITRLGAKGVLAATAKFIRHQQTRGTRATDFGPAWLTWIARERPDTQGSFLIGLPGGGAPTPTPPSYAERMAEIEAAAARDDQDTA